MIDGSDGDMPDTVLGQLAEGSPPLVIPEAGKSPRPLTLTLLTGINALFALLVALITARALGPSGRGIVALVVTIGATTSLGLSLGINTAARIYLPKKDSLVTFSHYNGLGLVLTVAQTIVASGAILAFAGRDHFHTTSSVMLSIAYCSLQMMVWLEFDGLAAFGHFNVSALFYICGSVGQISLLAVFAAVGHLTLNGALVSLDVGLVIEVLACVILLAVKGHELRPKYERHAYRLLLRTGMPSMGLNAALSFTFRFDRFVIAAVMGSAPLGVYSIAVAGSEVLRLFPAAWGQIAFYRLASGTKHLPSLLRTRRLILMVMASSLLVWALITPELVHRLLGSRYDGAITPWRILLVGEIGIMAYQIDGRILAAVGRTTASGAAGFAGLILVIPLDLILIPSHGLVGAAAASSAAYVVTGLLAMIAVDRPPGSLGTKWLARSYGLGPGLAREHRRKSRM